MLSGVDQKFLRDHIFWIVAVCAMLVISLLLIAGRGRSPSISRPAATSTTTADAEFTNKIQLPLLREVVDDAPPHNAGNVYAVDTISSGRYRGDTLALVIATWHYNADNSEDIGIGGYGYFISDASGMPIAVDDSMIVSCEGLGPCSTGLDEYSSPEFEKVGLTQDLKTDLKQDIPVEFQYGAKFKAVQKGATFRVAETDFFSATTTDYQKEQYGWSPYAYDEAVVVDYSPHGYPILRIPYRPGSYSSDPGKHPLKPLITPQFAYAMVLPFGGRVELPLQPGVTNTSTRWTTGTKTTAAYNWNYQDGACFGGMSADQVENGLIQTGTAGTGDALYELDPAKYSKVYTCLNAMDHIDWDSPAGSFTYTYQQFITMHPLFFWKSPYGEWVPFMRTDVYQQGPHD